MQVQRSAKNYATTKLKYKCTIYTLKLNSNVN